MSLDWKVLTIEQRRAFIEQHVADGFSASEIASRLVNCTRNAIIGFCHRNNVQLRAKPGHRPKVRSDQAKPKSKLRTRPLAPLKYVKAKRKPEPELTVEQPPVEATKPEPVNEAPVEEAAPKVEVEVAVETPASPAPIELPTQPWSLMSAKEKVQALHAYIAHGYRANEIADILGITSKAVTRVAERAGIRFSSFPQYRGVNILEIGRLQCRAPLWVDLPHRGRRPVGDWMFCGRPVVGKSSYCAICGQKYLRKPGAEDE